MQRLKQAAQIRAVFPNNKYTYNLTSTVKFMLSIKLNAEKLLNMKIPTAGRGCPYMQGR
jgi:isocitrate lyase